jgi:hypothetical protein
MKNHIWVVEVQDAEGWWPCPGRVWHIKKHALVDADLATAAGHDKYRVVKYVPESK